jgi:hypothetical protein
MSDSISGGGPIDHDQSDSSGSSLSRGRLAIGGVVVGVVLLAVTGALPVQFGVLPGGDGGGDAGINIVTVDVNDSLTEGDRLVVEVALANPQNKTVTDTIAANVSAFDNKTKEVELAPEGTKTVPFSFSTDTGDAGTHNVTVTNGTDALSEQVDIDPVEPPELEITAVETPVLVGEDITVTVEATNDEQNDWEGRIQLLNIDESTVDSVEPTIESGETITRTLQWETEVAGKGNITVTTSEGTESVDRRVDIRGAGQPIFNISEFETNSPITAGENLSVESDIVNTNENIAVRPRVQIRAAQLGDREFELERQRGGELWQVSRTFTTEESDGGETINLTLEVYRGNVSTERTTVVNITRRNVPVTIENITTTDTVAGETLEITVTATNTGNRDKTTPLTIDAGALGTNQTEITLAAGETKQVSATFETTAADSGQIPLTIRTQDTRRETAASLRAPLPVTVESVDTNETVAGGTLGVTVTATNTGEENGTASLTVDAGTLGNESLSLTLAAGESTTETLTFGTADTAVGIEETVTVSGPGTDSETTAEVSIAAPAPSMQIASFDAPDSLSVGDSLAVSVIVRNDGQTAETQQLTLDAGGLGTETRQVSLEPGRTTTKQFEINASAPGSYSLTVQTDSDNATKRVTVEATDAGTTTFEIVNARVEPRRDVGIVEGDTFEVVLELANTGQETDDPTPTWRLESDRQPRVGTFQGIDPIAPERTAIVRRPIETIAGESDVDRLVVETDGDQVTKDITVFERAESNLSGLDIASQESDASILEGRDARISVEIENVGEVIGSFDVRLSLGSIERTNRNNGLSPGKSTEVTFIVPADQLSVQEYDVEVSSGDASVRGTLRVEESDPAAFELGEIKLSKESADRGETVTLDATVENTGDQQGTQTVSLSPESVGDSKEVSLEADESRTVSFEVDTSGLSPGESELRVETADDSASATLTIEEPPAAARFTLSSVSVAPGQTVEQGADVNISATVSNVGGREATQRVSLTGDGFEDGTQVTLAPDATESVSFTFSTSDLSPGEYEPTLETANESVSRSLTVRVLNSVTLSLDDESVDVGGETTATVTATYSDGTQEVTQQASIESQSGVASVSGATVTGEQAGTATIEATFEGQTATAPLTVVGLESLSLSLAETELDTGESTSATVEATYTNGTRRTVTDRATVESQSGAASVSGATITGDEAGTTTIEATFEGEEATADITVAAELESLSLSVGETPLVVDIATEPTVEATYTNGTTVDVTDEAIIQAATAGISVDDTQVTGTQVGPGREIVASFGGETATTTLDVVAAELESLSLSVGETPLVVGTTTDLTVESTYTNGTTVDVTDEATIQTRTGGIRVDGTQVTGTQVGTGRQIAAGFGDKVATTTLEVVAAELESLSLTLADEQIEVGESTKATVEATYTNGTTVDVAQQASIESQSGAASVSGATVTGEQAGTTTIEATFEGEEATASLEVAAAPGELESLSLTLADEQINDNETTRATVEATYTNGTTREVTQQATINSGDSTVAVVGGATIDAKAPGETEITASFRQDGIIVSDTATLTVVDESDTIANTNLKTSVDGT